MRGAQKEARRNEMTAQEPSAKSLTKSLRKTLAAFLTMLLLFTSLPANMLEKAGVNTSFLPDSVAYATPADAAECDFAATYGLGDTLRLADGSTGVVGFVFDETLDAPVKVYNFEVEGLHTYYVGGSVQVLVHNTCGGQPPAPSHLVRGAGSAAARTSGRTADGANHVTMPNGSTLADGTKMSTDDALDAATEFLGPKYKDMGDGRYLSAGGTRQVRMGDRDITSVKNHAGAPHLNFEELGPKPPSNDTMTIIRSTRTHIFLTDLI